MQHTREQIDQLRADSQALDTPAFLKWALATFCSASFATSLGAEDQALLWLLQEAGFTIKVFSLDTGRLPEETYVLLQKNRDFYHLLNLTSIRPELCKL